MATSSSPPKAGCRLAKPCFDMSVVETFKTRTAMETIISVAGIVFVMMLAAVV